MSERKINKLLRYKLNRRQRRYLEKKWYINWCWGKGWFNFSNFLNESISRLKWYLKEYLWDLWKDIEKLCLEHDIDFTLWWTIWDFRKANFIFAFKIFKLLNWKKLHKWYYREYFILVRFFLRIMNFFARLWIFLVAYILLNRHWKELFKFGKKKKLEDLFIDYNENDKDYIWSKN